MFLIPCGNHSHLGGGSGAERMMSTLVYGWVERCSNVVGSGTRLFQDKYFLCAISTTVFCLMNYDEHVECLNKCILFHCICNCYASVHVFSSMHFILCAWGYISRV